MAARLAFFIDSGEMLERQSDVSQAPPWPYWPPNMPVTAPPSATPEGKPTAREAISAFVHAQRSAFRSVIARGDFTEDLIDWIEARDALHAETLRREVQAQATSDAGSFAAERAELQRLVADARAALQHGEERERVMREALERIGTDVLTRGEPDDVVCIWCGNDWEHREGCPTLDARKTLATAQAMKEGTP